MCIVHPSTRENAMNEHVTHTPGPWRAEGSETTTSTWVVGPNGKRVCTMAVCEKDWANAQFIAAAPTMKEALEEIDHWLTTYANKIVFDTFPEQALREALKATGATP